MHAFYMECKREYCIQRRPESTRLTILHVIFLPINKIRSKASNEMNLKPNRVGTLLLLLLHITIEPRKREESVRCVREEAKKHGMCKKVTCFCVFVFLFHF